MDWIREVNAVAIAYGQTMSAVKGETKPKPRVFGATAGPALAEAGAAIPWRRVGVWASVGLVFFLAGAVPMWLKASRNAAERELMQRALALSQMENKLQSSVIDARCGDYESARQTASEFFTSLRSQVNRVNNPAISTVQRRSLGAVLSQRDDIMALLARTDPAVVDRLSNLYVAYRKAMRSVQPQSKLKGQVTDP